MKLDFQGKKMVKTENKMLNISNDKENDYVAVIGMSLILPQADNVESFWENLCVGRDSVRDLPEERKKYIELYLDKIGDEKGNYKKFAYLDNITAFDNEKYNITPTEAKLMDPHQRIFIQTVYDAIEDAGYLGEKIKHTNTGVFVGCGSGNQYFEMITKALPEDREYALTGNLKSVIAGRLSYMLDLRGPAFCVDSACSSSLVAVHTACKSLECKECDMAIAGSVRIILLPTEKENISVGIESETSVVRAFDKDANGTVWGEGSVAFILKRLKDAKKDDDYIYAIIKSSAINQDGKSIGITAPNMSAQEAVCVKAWNKAGINPETLFYIESHGTGTKIGDPIEIEALNKAFRHYTNKQHFCAIGTLKSNIGHLEACSGAASLAKAILVLNKKVLPICTNFNSINPNIDLSNSAVYFNKANTLIKNNTKQPLICGVSSFGISGTNCHVVLEEYISERQRIERKDNQHVRKNFWPIDNESDDIEIIGVENNCSSDIQQKISRIVGKVLGYKQIDINKNINDYGSDSLTLLKIKKQINEELGLELKISDILSFPTIWKLSEHILDNRVNTLKKNNRKKLNKDIAIIGVALKFPDADTPEQFWSNIINKKISFGEFPEQRKELIEEFANEKFGDDIRFEIGAYLKDIEKFDYNFFDISLKDSQIMDPNQRLFLETAIKAINNAGYDIDKLKSKNIGVYSGFANNNIFNYSKIIYDIDREDFNMAIAPNLTSIIPGRVSYFMDFHGPCVNVDTACSSSLVAVDFACDALESGKCDLAVAGGVRIDLIPIDLAEKKIGIESSSKSIHVFDDKSDGTLWGEGVGVVILKPLNEAEKDGDYIYGVIEGRAINQDGFSMGITTPNSFAQSEVIVKAMDDARISAEDISYVEAHGTGTNLGDPIEIEGLQRAYEHYTDKKQFCAISSVKPNIGHLETVSGVASLIKATLALDKKIIPPIANVDIPSRKIDFINSPVYLAAEPIEWDSIIKPRRCAVSSFGFSGTNCHMILREYKNSVQQKKIDDIQFNKKKCWYFNLDSNKNEKIITTNVNKNLDLKLLQKLAVIFAKNIGLNKINAEDGFYRLGGHSISMLKVISEIKEQEGVEVSFNEFSQNDSLNKLTELISDKINNGHAVSVEYPDCVHVEDSMPFNLTEIQMSYLIGRDEAIPMGGVSTHVYIAIDTKYNISGIEKSFNKVINRHPMLRAVMTKDGRQKILDKVDYYKIAYEDISVIEDNEKQARLKIKDKEMSETVFDAMTWPLFEMFAYKLDDETSRLFIGIDMLIADGYSLMIIGNEILAFYENEDLLLPEITINMRDYITTYKKFKQMDIYQKAKNYWNEKYRNLPDAPNLPLRLDPITLMKPHFIRKTNYFDIQTLNKLKGKAQEINVSVSTLLCSLYTDMLGDWTNQPRMTINFTLFNRYPFQEDINKLVGDFTSVLLIDTDLEYSEEFDERTVKLQRTVNTALENRQYDGVEVIRDISQYKNLATKPVMPFVFTSMIFDGVDNPWDKFGTVVGGLSQTPQVYLDCQIICIEDSLRINWDYVDELFETDMIDSMFEEFISKIEDI